MPDAALVVLKADSFGQGKSRAVLGVVRELGDRGMTAAGITLVPVYCSGALVGYEAHLLGSERRLLVAHNDRLDWPKISFQAQRRVFIPQQASYQDFNVNPKALTKAIQLLVEEIQLDSDVFVVDDLGPLLLAPMLAHGSAPHPMVEALRLLLEQPKPITILVFGQRHIQLVPLQACQHLIQQSPLHRDAVQLDVTPTTMRALAADIIDRLEQRGALAL